MHDDGRRPPGNGSPQAGLPQVRPWLTHSGPPQAQPPPSQYPQSQYPQPGPPGSAQPPRPGPRRTEPGPRREPSLEQLRRARKTLAWFAVLLIGTVLTVGLPLPWKIAPTALGTAAVVVGILGFIRGIRTRMPALLSVVTGAGVVSALLLAAGTGAMLAVWPLTQQYEDCMSLALTQKATDQCLTDYRQSLINFSEDLQPPKG